MRYTTKYVVYRKPNIVSIFFLYLLCTTKCVVHSKRKIFVKKPEIINNYLEEYLNKVRSKGRYTFTWLEAKKQFDVSDKALNQSLYRLKSKKRVAQIRKGFYAIITPEYSSRGMVPAHLFINDLMKSLNRRYYVGLLSAAALHGASHQQPMEYFVITEKPAMRNIRNKKLAINFYVKKQWSNDNIVEKKTEAGYINVSSPELTALDLFYYLDSFGINKIATILKELMEEFKISDLVRTAKNYPQTSAIQRLGYMLDKEFNNKKLSDPLIKILNDRRPFVVPLSLNKNKEGRIDDKWKVLKNMEVESDI